MSQDRLGYEQSKSLSHSLLYYPIPFFCVESSSTELFFPPSNYSIPSFSLVITKAWKGLMWLRSGGTGLLSARVITVRTEVRRRVCTYQVCGL